MPCAAHVVGVQVGGGVVPPHTGDARSKNMNSSASSWGVMFVLAVVHPPGKFDAAGVSPDDTWMSLKTNRPHAEVAPTGVSNEKYWGMAPLTVSIHWRMSVVSLIELMLWRGEFTGNRLGDGFGGTLVA